MAETIKVLIADDQLELAEELKEKFVGVDGKMIADIVKEKLV
jgi:hypothetical protein